MRSIKSVLNALQTKMATAVAPYETIIHEADRLVDRTTATPNEAFLDRLAQAIDTADAEGRDELAEYGRDVFEQLRSRSR